MTLGVTMGASVPQSNEGTDQGSDHLGEMGSSIEEQELEGTGSWVQQDAAISICVVEARHEAHQRMQRRHLTACTITPTIL